MLLRHAILATALLPLFVFGQIESSTSKLLVIAHRGGILPGIPENTLAAFRSSIKLGVDFIEADLRSTSDGEIVIFHDETLDRTTNGHGRLSDYTLTELKQLDAGNGEKIPSYSELLNLSSKRNTKLLLDIKALSEPGCIAVVQEAREFKMLPNIMMGVRSLDMLKTLRKIDPKLHFLGFVPDVDSISDFVEHGAGIIRLWPDWIRGNEKLIHQIQQKGATVWTTAGNVPENELLFLMEAGVDGIIVDNPKILQAILERE